MLLTPFLSFQQTFAPLPTLPLHSLPHLLTPVVSTLLHSSPSTPSALPLSPPYSCNFNTPSLHCKYSIYTPSITSSLLSSQHSFTQLQKLPLHSLPQLLTPVVSTLLHSSPSTPSALPPSPPHSSLGVRSTQSRTVSFDSFLKG